MESFTVLGSCCGDCLARPFFPANQILGSVVITHVPPHVSQRIHSGGSISRGMPIGFRHHGQALCCTLRSPSANQPLTAPLPAHSPAHWG